MGLFVEEITELPKTGLITSNVYIGFANNTFSVMQYNKHLSLNQINTEIGYNPSTYYISCPVDFFNKDKTIHYENTMHYFYVTKDDISTIPFYNLVYRELKKKYPSAKDSI